MSSHDNLAICLPQQKQKKINQITGQRIDEEIRGYSYQEEENVRMVTLGREIKIKCVSQQLQARRKTKGNAGERPSEFKGEKKPTSMAVSNTAH